MEGMVVAPKRRGRKRKDAESTVSGSIAKRQGVATRGKMAFVGRYVKKEFVGSGTFLGKVIFYKDGLYRVDYEDGDCEDLDTTEVKNYLVEDGDLDAGLMARKGKLDELITEKNKTHAKKNARHAEGTTNDGKKPAKRAKGTANDAKRKGKDAEGTAKDAEGITNDAKKIAEDVDGTTNDAKRVEKSSSTEISKGPVRESDVVESNDAKRVEKSLLAEISNGGVPESGAVEPNDDDDGLSSDPDHDLDEDLSLEVNAPIVPPPQLPPSSRNIGVPDKFVSYLLSVYVFLRSFSIQLFLSPFGLDDFVGSLNFPSPNTLLDSIHVALMRVLKRHLEVLASDGSESASKCLRLTDWSLLDTLTWPIVLAQYMMSMRHNTGPQWKEFYAGALEKTYYSLSTGWKLMILQCLCDDVLESVELRSEINMREESEFGIDPDTIVASSDFGPTRVHPRYSKTSAYGDQEAAGIMTGNHGAKPSNNATYSGINGNHSNGDESNGEDGNGDDCTLCGMDGILLCCDGCPSSYHSRCIGISKMFIPEGTWYCPECAISRTELTVARGTLLKGAEVFGIDSYGHIFMGSCNHLLVLEGSSSEPCFRYYHQKDVPKVLQALLSSAEHIIMYTDICKAILCYWDIQKDVVIPFLAGVEGLSDTIFESREDSKQVVGAGTEKSSGDCIYMGMQFNPQAYINNYYQGDFAASAAASLAVLSSEEKEVAESHALDKRRKSALADNLLQMKAFSSVATRFFWPTTEKKLVEVPRERCSWCFQCKAPPSNRRGCLLNGAASSATKGAMKILAGLPAIKNGEGSLRAIAGYIILMEESLCGLVVGSFQNAAYRKQWRKRVEGATTLSTIKSLLLQLEENIHAIALSPDWFKLVESWLVDSPVTQTATIAMGSTQKRGLRGRRGRRPAAVLEIEPDDHTDGSSDFTWWRGGMFQKLILHRGLLPHSMAKKVACQGGRLRVPGLAYAEGCAIPLRSRQYFWRAAVDSIKNYSELALQVRRLDLYVRWGDLVRPEQTLQDVKGQEGEALAFRNAYVSDKKKVEEKIMYGVAFGIQKHLPSRIMKNIIEVEQSQDGSKKYWFSETRLPLYLIKEYEEKVNKKHLPLPDQPTNVQSHLQKRQLKACRKDIFSYMICKRDNLVKCSCASCPLEVLLGDAVKCNSCEGFCHERCTIGSTNHKDGKVEHIMTCKVCHTNSLPQSEKESPTTPLLFQGKAIQNVDTAREGFKQTSVKQPAPPVGHVSRLLETKSGGRDSGSASKGSKIASWGIIFKKNKDCKVRDDKEDQEALKFRMGHIIRKDNPGRISEGPKCHLCDQPYNSKLSYILCDTCKSWYHTDSLELEELKIPDVVGFKCCKCRRIRSPVCPYSKKLRTSKGKQPSSEPKEIESSPILYPPTELAPCISDEDPFLCSPLMVEQFPEHNINSGMQSNFGTSGPQKLPIRRLGNNDNSTDSFMAEQFPESNNDIDMQRNFDTSASRTGPQKLPVRRLVDNSNDTDLPENYSLPPSVEWDVAGDGFEGGFSLEGNWNFEPMEFEPQTYFSYGELLAPEIGPPVNSDVFNDSLGIGLTGSERYNMLLPACSGCSETHPIPELWCDICGLWMHSNCSPWPEQGPLESHWRCGKCRETSDVKPDL